MNLLSDADCSAHTQQAKFARTQSCFDNGGLVSRRMTDMNIDFSEGPTSLGQLVPKRVREGALSLTYGFLFALP